MNDVKVIKSDEQYREYLEEVHSLMRGHPAPGSSDAERLELLSVLVDSYEAHRYPVEAPDPVDAILFRMHERGLKQSDLVPYFGTRSRVSEVLGRKRPLTVPMIRALAVGLGISADTLIGLASANEDKAEESVDWSKFPVNEMVARGWLAKFSSKASTGANDLVKNFIADVGLQFGSMAFRRTIGGQAYSPTTKYALHAWLARVIQKARASKDPLRSFSADALSADFLREIAQLSWFEQGPLLAVEFLEKHGIVVVMEPQLKGTALDGAALKDGDGTPIIALTLRQDRLDNFWFTLLHEVAHLWKHVGQDETFLDDLDASSEDRREVEANRLAREAFIPRVSWKRSDAFVSPSKENIDALARELKISPAVIAGRLRRELNNYQLFNDMVGYDQVKRLFANRLGQGV
ncbi:ImmA/IrrE family metallo-endopeptidase [Paraburkholderia bryophila]|uniref:ImmA/IrrE family metallo-endopeptidase n=1 Tax=Paraburkholderia bryophila TaxID=420952 RepID=UPI00234A0DAB|nr:ImmA/IrrE family metallo-endopeptidase [Paraburkholderia bryophila]WCM20430.1 ImmA/IrrE family metallo-endopeptidase [Paraburkholderia bryophila]